MPALHHGGMNTPHHFFRTLFGTRKSALLALALLGALPGAQAGDTTAALQMQRWNDVAAAPASAERGRVFFSRTHGGERSCASCHGNLPTGSTRHAATGEPIAALAPAFNPTRFTDTAKADQWFRRNCNDVLRRECTASEKSDVLAWLLQFDAKNPPPKPQGH